MISEKVNYLLASVLVIVKSITLIGTGISKKNITRNILKTLSTIGL